MLQTSICARTPAGNGPGWNDARVDLLRKLWADGLSASQIADQLGDVTRNAVIGKVHRLGLRAQRTAWRQPRRTSPRRNPVRRPRCAGKSSPRGPIRFRRTFRPRRACTHASARRTETRAMPLAYRRPALARLRLLRRENRSGPATPIARTIRRPGTSGGHADGEERQLPSPFRRGPPLQRPSAWHRFPSEKAKAANAVNQSNPPIIRKTQHGLFQQNKSRKP